MTHHLSALERCVGDVPTFAEDHWGRRPLLHHAPGGFPELLSLGDVDHLVTGTLLRAPGFRLVKDGTPLDPATYTQTIRIGGGRVDRAARPDKVLAAFADGATIVLQALHRQWPPVATLCRDLEGALTHPVQANAYVTPPTAQGFAVHHDTHDVFVLQTRGRKRWRVYEPVVELAGPDQPWPAGEPAPGPPILEADLEPGDCLYLPRGWLHDAVAQEGTSVHVTVGILAFTWLDLWRFVLRGASEHVPFREGLPIGFGDDPSHLAEELPVRRKELAAWLDEAAGPEAATAFAERFWSTRRPLLAGQLEELERLRDAGPDATFTLRPGAVFRPREGDGEAVVLLGLRELRMPRAALPALEHIAGTETPIRAADLPGPLDEPSRLVLLRRLVREGVLRLGSGGDGG